MMAEFALACGMNCLVYGLIPILLDEEGIVCKQRKRMEVFPTLFSMVLEI
jgi:hypothetical protein